MIRRVLIAIVGLILLTLPRNASATDLPVATWDAQRVKVTISGSCDAVMNVVNVDLYTYEGGPSYGTDCQDTGQGGHFSFTYPLAPSNLPFPGYPAQLEPGDVVIVDDYGAPGPVTIHVPPFPALVTLGNLAQTYDGTPRNATVTTDPPGLAYAITYDPGSTAPVLAGSYQVAATVTNPSYAGSATGNLVISRASQTITFAALDPVVLGVQPIVISASASSGLQVTYTSSDPSVASVSGSTVTVHAAGTATITASQGGDPGSYAAAPDVSRDLVVSPPPTPPVAVPAAPGWTLFGLAALLFGVATLRLSGNPRSRRPTTPA